MDGVARRAGVGKSTVYLRWQDKDTLLTDAVGTRSGELGAVDTGTFRGDLLGLAVNLFRYYRDPAGWAALRITIDRAGAPQRLGHFVEEVANVQVEFVERIVARALERDEITPDVHAASITQCIYGCVAMQTLGVRLEGAELDDDAIDEAAERLVSLILKGVLS